MLIPSEGALGQGVRGFLVIFIQWERTLLCRAGVLHKNRGGNPCPSILSCIETDQKLTESSSSVAAEKKKKKKKGLLEGGSRSDHTGCDNDPNTYSHIHGI